MTIQFKPATKSQIKLRMAILGPAGAGKTFTMLRMLCAMGKRVAVIDTEHNSAEKYGDLFKFDTLDLSLMPGKFSVDNYISAINAAVAKGYDALGIDSLSHAWAGPGGLLEYVDKTAQATKSGSTFGAWRHATPKHNLLVDTMLAAPLHLITTMRVKMEHVQEKNASGKTEIRKVGMQPIQRDGLEYEFDVIGDIDQQQMMSISKTRCAKLKGELIHEPGEALAQTLLAWANSGAPRQEATPVAADEFSY